MFTDSRRDPVASHPFRLRDLLHVAGFFAFFAGVAAIVCGLLFVTGNFSIESPHVGETFPHGADVSDLPPDLQR